MAVGASGLIRYAVPIFGSRDQLSRYFAVVVDPQYPYHSVLEVGQRVRGQRAVILIVVAVQQVVIEHPHVVLRLSDRARPFPKFLLRLRG